MNAKVLQRGERKQHKHLFVHSRSLLLNCLEPQSSKAKLLLPIMPIGIVAYAFTLLWDNLCRNSCISQRKYNRATTDNINYTSFDGSTINTHGRFRICVFHSIVPCFTLFLCPKFVFSSCSINSCLGRIHGSCLRSLDSFL